ncbi:hypothetical protein Tco_0410533 [Tanacetum coccineum]
MVAYLKKPEGSKEFHQIVDFLNASHIRYAFTENPTIYVSLIKQFWETATARTLDSVEVELTATIDGKVKIVTEASVRRHLQLADSDGVSSLPNTEIFEQLSLMGPKKTSWEQFSSNIATAIICLATNRTFNFSKLIFDGPVVQGKGSTHPESVVPQPRSLTQTYVVDEAAFIGMDVKYGGATTTVTGLEAGQGSGNIDKTPTMPQDSPLLRVNTLGSDEGKIQGRQEHDMEFEFDLDVAKDVSTDEEDISIAKPVSTVGAAVTTASVDVSTATVSTAKDKGLRLQAKLEEEERRRIANVQEADSSFNIKEWDDIQARVEADEELAQRLQAEEIEKYFKLKKQDCLQSLSIREKAHGSLYTIAVENEIERAILESTAGSSKRDAEEELAQESSKRQKTEESSVSAEEPKDKEEELSQERL